MTSTATRARAPAAMPIRFTRNRLADLLSTLIGSMDPSGCCKMFFIVRSTQERTPPLRDLRVAAQRGLATFAPRLFAPHPTFVLDDCLLNESHRWPRALP